MAARPATLATTPLHLASALAGHGAVERLELQISAEDDRDWDAAAFASPALASLEQLALRADFDAPPTPQLANRILRALGALSAPGLRSLVLEGPILGAASASAFAELGLLAAVEALELVAVDLDAECASALAGAPGLAANARLERLTARGAPLGDAGGVALSRAPWAPHLRELDLFNCDLGAAGVDALLRAMPALARLKLAENPLGDDGVRALATSLPPVTECVWLWNTELGHEGMRALCARAELSISDLKLMHNQLDAEAIDAMVSAPLFGRLRRLDLMWNPLGDDGATALARGRGQLEELGLAHCRVGDRGLGALAGSPLLASVVVLDLNDNAFGAAGIDALAASPHLDRVKALWVRSAHELERDATLEGLVQRFGSRLTARRPWA